MKIALDFSPVTKKKAGVGYYTYNLAAALKNLKAEADFFFYSPPPFVQRALWQQSLVPFILFRDGIDLYHATNLVAPLFCPCKTVVTIHDLSSRLYPEAHTFFHRLHMSLIPLSANQAARIIVPSEAIKKEVEKHLRVSPEKVAVIHEGVGEEFKVIKNEEKLTLLRKKYNLPERFILYVGTLEPRKNMVRLVEAFAKVKGAKRDLKLVMAGKRGWQYEEIFRRVEELALENEVVFPGYIEDEDLPLLYNSAEVFAYPSIYEGFGLPVLEAMACGTPVVTSNVSSLPEIAGDAALLVEPKNPQAIADAIQRVLEHKLLRESLIEKGLQRVKSFTWEKCARETLEVYKSCF